MTRWTSPDHPSDDLPEHCPTCVLLRLPEDQPCPGHRLAERRAALDRVGLARAG